MRIRYEVSINGQVRCVAGIDGSGLLDARVAHHVPESDPVDAAGEPLDPDPFVYASASGIADLPEKQHVRWLSERLRPGDTLTIRILGPGEFDEPSSREPAPG